MTCTHHSVYECAICNEMRCMECDEPTKSDSVKTAVRWCPTHREAGRRGEYGAGCNCAAIYAAMGRFDGDTEHGHHVDCIAQNALRSSVTPMASAVFGDLLFGGIGEHDED